MNTILNKTAAVLAAVIGAMAVVAGGKVLLGIMPDYYVIDWVPVYNFSAGLFSMVITAPLIWKSSRYALPLAVTTLGFHSAVMVILQTAFHDVVAPDSIRAMTVRIAVWSVILGLMLFVQWAKAGRKQKNQPARFGER